MELNTHEWEKFAVKSLFDIKAGKYHYTSEYEEGKTPYISASNTNNGIKEYINLKPDFKGNCIVTGKLGCTAFYQPDDFCATSDVNIFRLKNHEMNEYIGTFLVTVINFSENYKWEYGRQCRVGDSKKIILKLPSTINAEGEVIPDWDFMEQFMKVQERKCRSIQTNNEPNNNLSLKVDEWKEFYLHKLFITEMGNGIDAIKTTSDNPKYNYVSRDSNGNGVVKYVDEIENEKPFDPGTMTLALGGSYLGSCFIQNEPFYTAQNVGILKEKISMSNYTKLFIATLIRNECRIKYQAFGRELNAHFRKDFTIKLPIKRDEKKQPIIDNTYEFSDEGYVPDWKFMEQYIKALPYGDRI